MPGRLLPSHPLADLFFILNEDELVLINCTGGFSSVVNQIAKSLVNWIAAEQHKPHGVVLAPLDESQKSTYDPVGKGVTVRGQEARKLLGGLDQWFPYRM